MPDVTRRVARPDGIVDAAAIRRAARLVVPGPPLPGGDPPDSELQLLKYLWHTVVVYGHNAFWGTVTDLGTVCQVGVRGGCPDPHAAAPRADGFLHSVVCPTCPLRTGAAISDRVTPNTD